MKARQKRQTGSCASCGVEGELVGRRLDQDCYLRHWRAKTLDQFPRVRPPAPQRPAGQPRMTRREAAHLRRAEYARLRRAGIPVVEAGSRVGVSSSTAWRYEAALIAEGWRPLDRRSTSPRPRKEIEELRAQLVAHLGRYPRSSFSVWDLTRVVDPLHKERTIRNVVARLAAEGLIEVVDQQRDPESSVPARRYRSRSGVIAGATQHELREAS